jgi:protein-S-isoprenylcysteine O-methyltransferase Ste14
MVAIIHLLFISTVILELLYGLLFILTIKLPGFRFWPPPKPRSWQFFTSWFIASLVAVNFLILGILDFDSAFLPYVIRRLPVALLIFVPASTLGSWSFITFGLRDTIGLGDRLVTNGPYQYTRNPQYIGDSLNILGYMILTNSWMVWLIGLMGIMLNILAPFTEEPWLEERFSEAYRVYTARVPRFFGKITKVSEKRSE